MPKLLAKTAIGAMPETSRSATSVQRFLFRPEVLRITGWSDTTLWREAKAQRFPAPVHISPGRVAWLESEVAEWQRKLIEARQLLAERGDAA